MGFLEVVGQWIDELPVSHSSFPALTALFALQPLWLVLVSSFTASRAISSVVERLLHTQEVAGSNPASRTTLFPSKDAGIGFRSRSLRESHWEL
jgi:hypothetical protein